MKEAGKLLEAIMSIPTMDDALKIEKKLTRKQLLVLGFLTDAGLKGKDSDAAKFLESFPKDLISEVSDAVDTMLESAGLKDLKANLKDMAPKV